MKRIIKEYDERKNEILDTAAELFFKTGYEKTTVEAIIKEADIAKGTFYYYFKSKLELLDELVKREVHKSIEKIATIQSDREMTGIEKLNMLLRILQNWKQTNSVLYSMLFKLMFEDQNIIIRNKFLKISLELFAPIYADIIRQGVEDGTCDCVSPEDAAEILIIMGDRLKESIAGLLFELKEKPSNLALIDKKLKIYENFIEKIIGAKEKSVLLFDREQFQSEKQDSLYNIVDIQKKNKDKEAL